MSGPGGAAVEVVVAGAGRAVAVRAVDVRRQRRRQRRIVGVRRVGVRRVAVRWRKEVPAEGSNVPGSRKRKKAHASFNAHETRSNAEP